jgi:NADH-quinone oxidoreductase subunit H
MKFAMFFLAEYINMTTVSAVAVTLFLGGWRAPWPLSLWAGANTGWWPVLWFLIKVFALLFCYVWLRGTLPRTRYDQLMALGWKILIPLSIVWILLIATIRAWRNDSHSPEVYAVGGLVLVLILILVTFWDNAAQRRAAELAPEEQGATDEEDEAGTVRGYPVPPLDLPHYHGLELGVTAPVPVGRATAVTKGESDKEVTGA